MRRGLLLLVEVEGHHVVLLEVLDLPLLVDVPGFSGVRIHPGNTVADTEGCLLLGLGKTSNSVTQSVAAFNIVFPQIRDALQRGEEVWINYQ